MVPFSRTPVHERGYFFQGQGDCALFQGRESVESLSESVLQGGRGLRGEFPALFSEANIDFSPIFLVSLTGYQVFLFQPVENSDHRAGAQVDVLCNAGGDDRLVLADGEEADQLRTRHFVVRGELLGVHLYRANYTTE